MGAIGFSRNRANVAPASLSSWKMKCEGDDAYYSLGKLAQSEIGIKSHNDEGDDGAFMPISALMEAKARVLYTNKTNLLPLLSSIATKEIYHKFSAVSGRTFSTELITARPYGGTHFKFISDAQFDKMRYVELAVKKGLLLGELDTLTGVAPADGTPAGGDVLNKLGSLVYADRTPAGLLKVEFKPRADQSFADDLGIIKNAKVTFESVGEDDDFLEANPTGVKATFEVDALQTVSEFNLLDSLSNTELDFKLTYLDGLIATLNGFIGTGWDYQLKGTVANSQLIHLSAQGFTTLSNFATLFS